MQDTLSSDHEKDAFLDIVERHTKPTHTTVDVLLIPKYHRFALGIASDLLLDKSDGLTFFLLQ